MVPVSRFCIWTEVDGFGRSCARSYAKNKMQHEVEPEM